MLITFPEKLSSKSVINPIVQQLLCALNLTTSEDYLISPLMKRPRKVCNVNIRMEPVGEGKKYKLVTED